LDSVDSSSVDEAPGDGESNNRKAVPPNQTAASAFIGFALVIFGIEYKTFKNGLTPMI
jgi:hypothetical protein